MYRSFAVHRWIISPHDETKMLINGPSVFKGNRSMSYLLQLQSSNSAHLNVCSTSIQIPTIGPPCAPNFAFDKHRKWLWFKYGDMVFKNCQNLNDVILQKQEKSS